MKTTLIEGSGIAVLITLRVTLNVLPPSDYVFLHHFPVSKLFLGLSLQLAILSLAATLLVLFCRRFAMDNVLWAFVIGGIVTLEAYDSVLLFNEMPSLSEVLKLLIAVVGLVYMMQTLRLDYFKKFVRIVHGSLVLLGFSMFWMVPELLYSASQSSSHESEFYSKPKTQARSESRIVWILFDELSYDQIYEHRWSGLNLPNFDRLLDESMTFADVHPAGYQTRNVIPSLLLGRQVSQIKVSSSGELSIYLEEQRKWQRFDAGQTLFADSHRLGWSSGITGWYIPYCRALAGWVNDCAYFNGEPLSDNLDPAQGIFFNAAAPLLNWFSVLMPKEISGRYNQQRNLERASQNDYEGILQRAEALIRDPDLRFVYIHLNVPHPPAIFNRRLGTFSGGGSYLDNLVLADTALGQLLNVLQNTAHWNHTTLIVCGDHSWRTRMWKASAWTKEDQAASRGQFDDRPVLSIRYPGLRIGEKVTMKVHLLGLHDVIEGLMREQIRSAEDVVRFMQHRTI